MDNKHVLIPILAAILATLLSAILVDYMLYKSMEALSARVIGVEEANKDLRANVKETLQRLEEVTTRIDSINEKLANLESSIDTVNKNTQTSIKEIESSMEKALTSIKVELQKLAGSIGALKNQLEDLKENVSRLEESDKTLSTAVASLQQQLSKLEKQVASITDMLAMLQQEVTELGRQASFNTEKIADLEDRLSTIQSMLSSLSQEVAALRNTTASLAERIDKLNAVSTAANETVTMAGNETAAKTLKWLILVYMAADNNLEHYAIEDLNEMEEVGSTSDVAVVALIDRAKGFDESNGGWTSTRVYLVTRDNDPNTIGSKLLLDLGEQSTNDPRLLRWFVENMTARFPARHVLLVLWNHGAGILGGFAVDMDSRLGVKTMDVMEIANALRGLKVDIIGFDACLMGGYEVAYYLQHVGKIMVASADTEPLEGWPYKDILEYIASNPDASEAEVAASIVRLYGKSLAESGMPATLIALNLTALQSVNEGIAALSYYVYMQEDVWALARAMDAAVMYPLSDQYMLFLVGAAQYGYIDLYNTLVVAYQLATERTRTVIGQLIAALENAVIASYTNTDSPMVLGLSAMGRESLYSLTAEAYNKTLWEALATPWSSLVDKVDSILLQDYEPPRVSVETAETANGLEVRVRAESQDISGIYLEIRSTDNITLNIVPLTLDTSIGAGSEHIPLWLNGSVSSYMWSGSVYQLVSGGAAHPSTVVIDTATGLGIVPGVYRDTAMDYTALAVMFFNTSTGEPLYAVDAENTLLLELTDSSEFLPFVLTPMGWFHTSGYLPVSGLRLEPVEPDMLGIKLDMYLVAVDLAGNVAEELLYNMA
ncbi:clostripain-related cysteine peptidase [Pyrodictium abyssi]